MGGKGRDNAIRAQSGMERGVGTRRAEAVSFIAPLRIFSPAYHFCSIYSPFSDRPCWEHDL